MAEDSSMESTPTWAVAAVCFVLILIAVIAEHALHFLAMFLRRRKRKTLNKALYDVQAELRSFGFMSLVLNVAQQPISKICIPDSLAASFLPCKKVDVPPILSEDNPSCPKGKVPLLSTKGTEQLLLLIFTLAASHVLSCLLTFGLGLAKMKKWESWEEETRTLEYQLSTDPRRFKLTRQTSFGRRHLKIWSKHRLLLWLVCFLRQFKTSVSKADYLALRHSFITAHFPHDQTFDFRNFLRRSLDNDFAVVAGISHWSWVYAIFFIFFNAQGFYSHFWLPLVPPVILLIVGTKLEVTITSMCLESSSNGSVVPGAFRVEPNNDYFWFGQPRCLLHIIHFILFQNAFQLAFFMWTWYKFGYPSCFHRETEDITLNIGIGGLVQIFCAYVTLPLYALVTRVASSKTEIIFTEDIMRGLRNWRRAAKRSLAKSSPRTPTSPEPEPEPAASALPADPSPCHAQHANETTETEPSSGLTHPHAEEEKGEPPEQPSREETVLAQVLERVGEETARHHVHGGAAYDGEVSFAVWQHQEC